MTVLDLNLMHAVEGVSRLVANSFVSGLWQGIVLAAGVALCLRLLPRTTAAVRFAIWTAVFAVLAVMPLVHAYTSGSGGGTAGHGAMVQLDVRWTYAIAALWLTVSLVRAVKLAMSAVRLRGIWKRAVPVEGCDEVLQAAGFRGVELCTSKDVDRPSVIGFFSPRILIPEELFARLTTAEFGQIVLHEVGHLRRADDWINLLQKLSLVLVPLNPVLMWIERRLCLERELACDDDVLRLTKAPKAYATCLTNLAEHRLGRRAAALSLGAWERKSELARRVHSILLGGKRMGTVQARVVMGALVLGLLGGSAELARCPQLVSFSRGALPVAAEVQSSSGAGSVTAPGYMPVSFHEAGKMPSAAHETLLKATMPMDNGDRSIPPVRAVGTTPVKHRRAVVAPAVQRSRQNRAAVLQELRGWVMLTSWEDGPDRSGVVVSGARPQIRERVISISYAAVPTAGGWLVIQL
ncbi:MAG TPA: M56 family metallopeptidase [Edaphobacter sp.]|jgi:beta-lactamase regulating signal transducer with metallopeptidase domain|nr:M56 family metallopeptidase [Edaphobacter sp.]